MVLEVCCVLLSILHEHMCFDFDLLLLGGNWEIELISLLCLLHLIHVAE